MERQLHKLVASNRVRNEFTPSIAFSRGNDRLPVNISRRSHLTRSEKRDAINYEYHYPAHISWVDMFSVFPFTFNLSLLASSEIESETKCRSVIKESERKRNK